MLGVLILDREEISIMAQEAKTWLIYTLMALLLLLGLGGIGGGITLLADPSGQQMGLPPDLLKGLFIENYFLPGTFLIVVMGFGPYLVFYAVWKRLSWGWAAVLAQGFLLIGWIIFQIALWGRPIPLQMLYLLWGVALVGMAFLPGTRAYFSSSKLED